MISEIVKFGKFFKFSKLDNEQILKILQFGKLTNLKIFFEFRKPKFDFWGILIVLQIVKF